MKHMRYKIIELGSFKVDNKISNYFQAYEDGTCYYEVRYYTEGLTHEKNLQDYDDETATYEFPYKIIITGCNDSIYIKRFSVLNDNNLQKLRGLFKSGKVLIEKQLIHDFKLVHTN